MTAKNTPYLPEIYSQNHSLPAGVIKRPSHSPASQATLLLWIEFRRARRKKRNWQPDLFPAEIINFASTRDQVSLSLLIQLRLATEERNKYDSLALFPGGSVNYLLLALGNFFFSFFLFVVVGVRPPRGLANHTSILINVWTNAANEAIVWLMQEAL